jgi:hypothetical protein
VPGSNALGSSSNCDEDMESLHYFAVFDGHGGAEAAKFCAAKMHSVVEAEIAGLLRGEGAATDNVSVWAWVGARAAVEQHQHQQLLQLLGKYCVCLFHANDLPCTAWPRCVSSWSKAAVCIWVCDVLASHTSHPFPHTHCHAECLHHSAAVPVPVCPPCLPSCRRWCPAAAAHGCRRPWFAPL